MLFNTAFLLLLQVIDTTEALEGFSNSGIFAVGVLCVVAAGIQASGALELLLKYVLRHPRNVWQAQIRMMLPIALISGVCNNTPLVAMMIPILDEWCKRIRIAPSKLMIPLSYAAILGGTCTLIGTSTNLVVVGFLQKEDPSIELEMFEIGLVGLPLAIFGIIYVMVASHWLLPDNSGVSEGIQDLKSEYKIMAVVDSLHPACNINVIRSLEGASLVEIERARGGAVAHIGDDTIIESGDKLVFICKAECVRQLCDLPGLLFFNQKAKPVKLSPPKIIVEAVISKTSWLIGKVARECSFRSRFGVTAISVCRQGEHLQATTLGSTCFKFGDCLLLECERSFLEKYAIADFATVVELTGGFNSSIRHRDLYKLILAPLISIVMIALNAFEVLPILTLSLLAVFCLYITKSLTIDEIKSSANISVVVIMAASFGMATALDKTGVADEMSKNLVDLFQGGGNIGILSSLYLCTAILTALLSNASAVALMFPIAWRITEVPLKARMYILMYAASADFSTPIGYQTNLMVMKPGGYKFLDYTKFGLPLQMVLCVSAVLLTNTIFT